MFHDRSKHIEMKYHFIRDMVLGSGKVGSFTTELISRVCPVKTLKTPQVHGLSSKKPDIKMINNIMR
jgi:hypothetical protein